MIWDCFLMTICGDKAAQTGMRTSAIYNWAVKHCIDWNEVVCADENDLLIGVLNDINLESAHDMLSRA